MQDHYSLAKCEQYGRRLAQRLVQQHFGAQPDATLDGPALLTFTPVRQLNLLVLRQLLARWQAEAARLQSPYFDYAAAPVQTALAQLMNTLSRHICLGRAALEPLLAQATADALRLAADPAGAFEALFLPADRLETTAAALQDQLRYLDQDKEFYRDFVASLPVAGALPREAVAQRFEAYHRAHYRNAQALPQLVQRLGVLLPLTVADLREDGPTASAAASGTAGASAAPAAEPAAAPTAAPAPRPSAATAPSAPAEPVARPTAVPVEAAGVAESAPGVPLHEKLKSAQPAAAPLAEALRTAGGAAAVPLAERSAPKVTSLREAISINQRFSFINELFNGENMEYHAAIAHLDGLPTAAEAQRYVEQDLTRRYDWSRKEEHVGKLLKLIERKFS